MGSRPFAGMLWNPGSKELAEKLCSSNGKEGGSGLSGERA